MAAICKVYCFPKFETEMRSFHADASGSSAMSSSLSSVGDFDAALVFFAVFLGG